MNILLDLLESVFTDNCTFLITHVEVCLGGKGFSIRFELILASSSLSGSIAHLVAYKISQY